MWREQVVDCFKFLTLNLPGVNERINEVQSFCNFVAAKFGNESCLNTKKILHSEPICSLNNNRVYLRSIFKLFTSYILTQYFHLMYQINALKMYDITLLHSDMSPHDNTILVCTLENGIVMPTNVCEVTVISRIVSAFTWYIK
jgi:hypothetical protein